MNYLAGLVAQHLGLWGAVLGGLVGGGLLAVTQSILKHRVTLSSRVIPYLPIENPRVTTRGVTTQLAQIIGLPISTLVENLAEMFGFGAESVSHRLRLADLGMTARNFTQLRVATVALGLAVVSVISGLGSLIFALSWGRIGMILGVGMFCSLVVPDLYLSHRAEKRQQQITQQTPDFVDFLALAVGAGVAVPVALDQVAQICGGPIAKEVRGLLNRVQTGASLPDALREMYQKTTSPPLLRLVDALASALERGTPLAELLREQALDTRHEFRQQMLVNGGRAEIAMLIPVVFGLLPLTVIFALFPALETLHMNF